MTTKHTCWRYVLFPLLERRNANTNMVNEDMLENRSEIEGVKLPYMFGPITTNMLVASDMKILLGCKTKEKICLKQECTGPKRKTNCTRKLVKRQ